MGSSPPGAASPGCKWGEAVLLIPHEESRLEEWMMLEVNRAPDGTKRVYSVIIIICRSYDPSYCTSVSLYSEGIVRPPPTRTPTAF